MIKLSSIRTDDTGMFAWRYSVVAVPEAGVPGFQFQDQRASFDTRVLSPVSIQSRSSSRPRLTSSQMVCIQKVPYLLIMIRHIRDKCLFTAGIFGCTSAAFAPKNYNSFLLRVCAVLCGNNLNASPLLFSSFQHCSSAAIAPPRKLIIRLILSL